MKININENDKPEVQLISHASILIKVDGIKILTDPWFFDSAFNDGWELSPKPNLDFVGRAVSDIDIIWISHEHPDHLHFPTLKWLLTILEKKVTIFFQKNNSDKVFNALRKIGYDLFVKMPHMEKIDVSERVKIAAFSHRHIDSSLAVFIDDFFWILNINDTELNSIDIDLITNNFGCPSVLYNQFSIAGANGIESCLKADAITVLDKIVEHHKGLKANITIPFASFVRFARKDNNYLNAYRNTVFDAQIKLRKAGFHCCVQSFEAGPLVWKNPDELPINVDDINELSVENFTFSIDDHIDDFNYKVISPDDVKKAIENKIKEWRKKTNPLVWWLLNLEKININVSDWNNQIWQCDVHSAKFLQSDTQELEADIYINSQPLLYAFQTPFGIQSLGVSGRYKFSDAYIEVPRTWKLIRIISSLSNSDIYLSINSLFSFKNLKWMWSRRFGLIGQVNQQIKRFK